ncbi:hypothetical protein ACFQ48_16260 [Hymenobacter caeli]|uniref:VWA domain-containing protein n=1 Tax=Hymenobacter caeli TaxID=2735894 RepID=A0ABX2FWE5_9BACT|nr:hypothetical protein [Hymenobacter caeli]NRT20705.1 hypothetical protein [Hymenobacter caeli]
MAIYSLLIQYGLAAACLLLGLGLAVAAWRRPRHHQRGARVLAGALAAAALWLAAYPPLRAVPAARAEAIVLTPGYRPDTLAQLLRRLGAGTPVWRYAGAPGPARARPLGSLLALAEQRPALRRVHVLGQGLPAAELPQLGPVALQIHAPPAFAGFETATWSPRLRLGESLTVEGTAATPAGAPAWVSLQADGGGRDSVRVPAGGGAFRLRYRPRAAGLALYRLVLRPPGQPARAEPVPLEVAAAPHPPVLLLSAAPAFEFKFLKNHLAGQPRAVAVRTGVSRGLVQTEFLNQPAQALDRLTPALLARYAVVVADAGTLAGLPGAEGQALRGALQAGRLGLVVLADAAPLPAATPGRAAFAVVPRPAAATPQPLAWADAPSAVRAPLPAALRPSAALQPLVRGPGAALVAARCRFGLGAVVVSVVPETFRWALAGQDAAYASFWSRLLAAATPPAPAAATWRVATAWPRAHNPAALQLAAGAFPAAPPAVRALAGGPAVALPLRQDPRLPEWSTAVFWPAAAGWHQVRGPGKTDFSFYVFGPDDWPGPEAAQRRLAAAQHASATAPPTAPSEVREPWPAGWFFGLFLLAAGYLWLEEKL